MDKGHQQPQKGTYTAPIRSGATGINDDDPRYKCCCGAMHVRTGAKVLAVVELSLAALAILGTVSGAGDGHYKSGTRWGSFINGVITIVVCSLMVYGLRTTRRYMLVPHMVFQVLGIITYFIFAILFIVSIVATMDLQDSSHFRHEQYRTADKHGINVMIMGGSAAIFALVGTLQVWFFLVVLGAFRYLRDKETGAFQGNPMVHYGGWSV